MGYSESRDIEVVEVNLPCTGRKPLSFSLKRE